jgi:hypothetical protein
VCVCESGMLQTNERERGSGRVIARRRACTSTCLMRMGLLQTLQGLRLDGGLQRQVRRHDCFEHRVLHPLLWNATHTTEGADGKGDVRAQPPHTATLGMRGSHTAHDHPADAGKNRARPRTLPPTCDTRGGVCLPPPTLPPHATLAGTHHPARWALQEVEGQSSTAGWSVPHKLQRAVGVQGAKAHAAGADDPVLLRQPQRNRQA